METVLIVPAATPVPAFLVIPVIPIPQPLHRAIPLLRPWSVMDLWDLAEVLEVIPTVLPMTVPAALELLPAPHPHRELRLLQAAVPAVLPTAI